jgi:hypothetical protein
MQKVLKRIGALPSLVEKEGQETFAEIKGRAGEILKSWGGFLDEINEMQKKEEEGGNKKEGLNGEAGKAKEAEGEAMEEVEKMGKTVDEPEFVLVEGNGEADPLAQEVALAAKENARMEDPQTDDVRVESESAPAAAVEFAEMKGTFLAVDNI